MPRIYPEFVPRSHTHQRTRQSTCRHRRAVTTLFQTLFRTFPHSQSWKWASLHRDQLWAQSESSVDWSDNKTSMQQWTGAASAILTCFLTSLMVCWSCAMNLKEWRGTTLSSWSAVSSSMAGYCTSPDGTQILCTGEYLHAQTTPITNHTHKRPRRTCKSTWSPPCQGCQNQYTFNGNYNN